MRLNENAIAAFKAASISAKDIQIDPKVYEAFKNVSQNWAKLDTPFDVFSMQDMLTDWINQTVQEEHKRRVAENMDRVLPVTMEVDGESKVIGHALIDFNAGHGDSMIHAVIDADPRVAELLKVDMGWLSVRKKSDMKEKTNE